MAAVLPAPRMSVTPTVRALVSRPGIWLVAGLWLYLVFMVLWFTQGWGDPAVRQFVVTWSPLPAEFMALGLLLPLLRDMPAGFRRGGWMLLTLASVSDVVATGWWALRYEPPTPASSLWADLPYFFYYPLGAAAFLMFYRELGGSLRSRAMLLDAATLALGFGATLWLFLLHPQIERAGWGDPMLINLAAFCAGNGVLMVVMSLMIMQVLDWRADGALLLVAAAVFLAFTTDLKWLEAGTGYYIFDVWSNIGGYSLHFALLGTGAFLERHWRIPATVRVLGGNRYSVLPIVSVLAAVGMLYGEHVQLRGLEWTVLAGFALAGTLLVVARQQGIRSEIRRLGDALARRDAQAHLTELIRRSVDMVAVVDVSMRPSFISPASEKVLGIPAVELMSRPAAALLGAEHEDRLGSFLDALAATPRQRADMELIVHGTDGERRALQILGSNQLDNPAIAGIALTVRDVTGRRRLEREVLEIALLERERLAVEIRESLGSELLRVKGLIARLSESARRGADPASQVATAVAQVNHSIDMARRLSVSLSPLHVARGALDVAIRSMCGDYAQRFSMQIDFSANLGTRGVSSREAEHVYRIAQEILEHAACVEGQARLDVGLYCERDVLHLQIGDAVPPATKGDSRNPFGLQLAAYRAHVLGGTLRRCSGEDGSRIDVTIPLTT